MESTHKDKLRKKLDLQLYCAKHPTQSLKLSHNLSRVGASSAYEVNMEIIVHPCEICEQESNRIKEAVKALINIDKSEF